MKNLNDNEHNLYFFLIEDFKKQQKHSFVDCLDYLYFIFRCNPYQKEDTSVQNIIKKIPEQFIKSSDILFTKNDCSIIGKYENFFWQANQDGNISFIGTTFLDIAKHCNSFIHLNEKDFCSQMKSFYCTQNVDWKQYIKKFKTILKRYDINISFGAHQTNPLDLKDFIEATEKFRININLS